MKLLFDQNISHRITTRLDYRFKDCQQVRHVGLEDSSDKKIWEYAKEHHFSIVTFDADFYDISLINGCPPKIIWLRGGNMTTTEIATLIDSFFETISEFLINTEQACLEIG